jgi:hypothetical protein
MGSNPIETFFKKVDRFIYNRSHVRFADQIVVIESDDWGMKRNPCADVVARYGTPGAWANEENENQTDLKDLFDVLGAFRDQSKRPACMTANFVVANPDYDAMEKSGFTKYVDRFIDETTPKEILDAYREGIKKHVFYPQYHGRRHFSANAFVADLKENGSGARDLMKAGCYGAASLIKGQNWRYHSEYFDWNQNKPVAVEQVLEDLKASNAFFEKQFGFTSKSTIPPHYIFTDETEKAWREAGIRFVQGTGYCLKRNGNNRTVHAHYMGRKSNQGLTYLTRTIKFEPREGRENQGLLPAFENVPVFTKLGIPIVIDTHRINYTGTFKKRALIELGKLLEFLTEYHPVFLTSVELGEAIENGGKFTDVFSGERRTLKVQPSNGRRMTARLYDLIHPM